jgi:hypothetical protein
MHYVDLLMIYYLLILFSIVLEDVFDFLRKLQILLLECNLIFNVKILIDLKQKQTNI